MNIKVECYQNHDSFILFLLLYFCYSLLIWHATELMLEYLWRAKYCGCRGIKIIVGAHADHCGCSEIIVGAHLSIVGARAPTKVYKLTPMPRTIFKVAQECTFCRCYTVAYMSNAVHGHS